MYHYVEDKEFVSSMRRLCGEITQDLCHYLKEDYGIGSVCYLVGSGAKNLITQNASQPIDLDYNLEITKCEYYEDCRKIKEAVRKSFNKALRDQGLGDCQDSTSSLTTEKIYFTNRTDTSFSIDVCIVGKDNRDNLYRLIHDKTGFFSDDEYHWDKAPNPAKIKQKVDYIKNKGKWQLVREQYLNIKNMYLQRNDHNHPSFICYVEAVNDVYNHLRQTCD